MVPLLVVVLLTKFEGKEWVGLGVFLLAALTDFLDGFIARRKKQVTQLGKLLDPAADKLLTSAAFISLVELGLAPAWMVVVIIAREFGRCRECRPGGDTLGQAQDGLADHCHLAADSQQAAGGVRAPCPGLFVARHAGQRLFRSGISRPLHTADPARSRGEQRVVST